MYSLHLTGSPWFLLLIPPGLWILWRQYHGQVPTGSGAGSGSPRRILFALQAVAMLVLAVSLTAPELRRHRVEFHNPAILIIRDQSSSFQGGSYLGLGGAYRDFQARLTETFGQRKFDILIADFSDRAWPVSGFPGTGRPESRQDSEEGGSLTSLASVADFIDSAAVPNLQAAFLFSDGRSNLDSAKASRTWRIPVYPVVFAPDSVSEIQPERARLTMNPEGAELDLSWRKVGEGRNVGGVGNAGIVGNGPNLRILQGSKVLLTRKLPAPLPNDTEEGRFRMQWNPGKGVLEGGESLRAVLSPADPARNFNPYNDTLAVAFSQGKTERVIHVLRPIRSLDEKGMLGILQAWEGTRVAFFGAEDIGRLFPGPGDQVWVEAGALASAGPASMAGQAALKAWLAKSPAQTVVYARSEPGRNLQVTGGVTAWRAYSPAAEIKAGRIASEGFPDEAVRLKNLADASLELPEAKAGTRVEVREGERRGMLMGRIPLSDGRQAFFFSLPAVWGPLFDPQGDFATRENIAAYVKAAHALASGESGTVRVSKPARAYRNVPFDVDVRIPTARTAMAQAATAEADEAAGAAGAAKAEGARTEFTVTGPGFEKSWPLPSSDGQDALEYRIKDVSLPRGEFRLELRDGARSLWRDSLTVSPKAALELARIGFERSGLDDAASRSGGRLLEPGAAGFAAAGVTFELPNLPAAQIRMEKTTAIRLYNTLVQCLLILLLLSGSWFLRKKWDFD